jgi:hypothetical protein
MFCLERGWGLASHTSEGEALYTKGGVNGYFRWFEVVAYETVGLLRVGHG